jgi:hypothetical protein
MYSTSCYKERLNFENTLYRESFDIEEYAGQSECLKNNSARILNNVFRDSLRKVLKKHELV